MTPHPGSQAIRGISQPGTCPTTGAQGLPISESATTDYFITFYVVLVISGQHAY